MISNIEQYLAELKKELAGCDRATIQDALSDAEEYLRTALSSARSQNPAVSEAEVLNSILRKYGEPVEVAAAYKEVEYRTSPVFGARVYTDKDAAEAAPATPAVKDTRPFLAKVFGVYGEPRAWGALFYLLFSLATGIIYFTWAVTGISVSAGLIILIIGIPFAALFLASVRGIALVEGRMIEALVGVRMPRRAKFAKKNGGGWKRYFKNLFTDGHTWLSIVYMIIHLPLGIIYFTVLVTLIAMSFGLAVWPIVASSMDVPLFITTRYEWFVNPWTIPLFVIGGVLLLTATMHLAKLMGKGQGEIARALLVRG